MKEIKNFNTRLPIKLIKRLKEFVKKTDLKVQYVVTKAIEAFLDKEEKKGE